jgi:hypothetical protein
MRFMRCEQHHKCARNREMTSTRTRRAALTGWSSKPIAPLSLPAPPTTSELPPSRRRSPPSRSAALGQPAGRHRSGRSSRGHCGSAGARRHPEAAAGHVAVVLDLVQPLRPGRRMRGQCRQLSDGTNAGGSVLPDRRTHAALQRSSALVATGPVTRPVESGPRSVEMPRPTEAGHCCKGEQP